MSGLPPHVFNERFITKVSSSDGREKTAEFGSSFVRDHLREKSVSNMIIPAENIGRADCQVSEHQDTLIKLVQLEPRTRAMVLDFRGQPEANYFSAPRAAVGFHTISSELMQKTEQELMVYDFPITKFIEDNIVKDIDEIKDREFVINGESCIQALQKEANGNTIKALTATTVKAGTTVEFSARKGELARVADTDTAAILPVQKTDFVYGRKMLNTRRLKCVSVLVTEGEWDDMLQWTMEDVGSKVASEILVDGYKYNTIGGLKIYRTIKTDIFRQGNMYFFVDNSFLGKSYTLNNTKFYIDKIANNIMFQAWQDVGMLFANIAGVRKVELYSADATTIDTNGLRSNFIPVEEDALGELVNRVDQGLKYPQVSTY